MPRRSLRRLRWIAPKPVRHARSATSGHCRQRDADPVLRQRSEDSDLHRFSGLKSDADRIKQSGRAGGGVTDRLHENGMPRASAGKQHFAVVAHPMVAQRVSDGLSDSESRARSEVMYGESRPFRIDPLDRLITGAERASAVALKLKQGTQPRDRCGVGATLPRVNAIDVVRAAERSSGNGIEHLVARAYIETTDLRRVAGCRQECRVAEAAEIDDGAIPFGAEQNPIGQRRDRRTLTAGGKIGLAKIADDGAAKRCDDRRWLQQLPRHRRGMEDRLAMQRGKVDWAAVQEPAQNLGVKSAEVERERRERAAGHRRLLRGLTQALRQIVGEAERVMLRQRGSQRKPAAFDAHQRRIEPVETGPRHRPDDPSLLQSLRSRLVIVSHAGIVIVASLHGKSGPLQCHS